MPLSPPKDPLNVFAANFIPLSPVEECKHTQKTYSSEELRALRATHTALPAGYEIPTFYNREHRRSAKGARINHSEAGFIRAQNVLETSRVLMRAENPLMKMIKADDSEAAKSSQKIRGILNKLSPQNLEKLAGQLTEDVEYTQELLSVLVRLIFERATALSFAELYAKLCGLLRKKFRDKTEELASSFRIELVEMCHRCFYNEDGPVKGDDLMDQKSRQKRRLLGNVKFVGLLFKQKMLKSGIMYECFDVLLKEDNLSDESIETFCTLFTECAGLLSSKSTEQLNEYTFKLRGMRTHPGLSKRIVFKIEEILEHKTQLVRRVPKKRPVEPSPIKFVPVESVLETRISETDKTVAHSIAKAIQAEAPTDEILENHQRSLGHVESHSAIWTELLRFALSEFHKEDTFRRICEFLECLVTRSLTGHCDLQESLRRTREKLEDIQLDAPSAAERFVFLEEWLGKTKGKTSHAKGKGSVNNQL